MQGRGGRRSEDPIAKLVQDTQRLVAQLVNENRALKLRNRRLTEEIDRVSAGWDEIKRLARSAPRSRRRTGA